MNSIAAFILTKRASFAQKVVETRCARLGCRQPQYTLPLDTATHTDTEAVRHSYAKPTPHVAHLQLWSLQAHR